MLRTIRRWATPIALLTALSASFAFVACSGDDDDDDDAPTAAATNTSAAGAPTTAPTRAATTATTTAPTVAPTTGAAALSVRVADNSFQPGTLTVPVGSKVTWTWSGGNPHSVVGTFNGAAVTSPTLTGSGTYEFTFAAAGTFQYTCGIHGDSMPGTVVVQ
ncbi:MAG: cupredoxin domain-containing protein [Tepidiformaceae bacterium]